MEQQAVAEDEEEQHSSTTAVAQGYDPTARLVDTLVAYEVPEDIADIVAVELSRDFILANYKDEETWEKKYDLKNVLEYITALFPPQDSILQGKMRSELGYGDMRPALTGYNMQRVRQAMSLSYARITRSRSGWQQELLAQQTKEIRQIRPMDQPKRKGFFEKIFG